MPSPTIRLTNAATRRKEAFAPLDPGNVRMYVCGPTVYDRAHLGNARSAVVFDVLYRLLRHRYGAENVTYVRNFTDVDDKINARAAETGRPIGEITDETIRWYHEDMDALGVLRPSHEPRATDYIPQMAAMIEELARRGHAYAKEGHVLFEVRTAKEFPAREVLGEEVPGYGGYGSFSGRSLDDMIAGARVEVAPYKRDPMDFVLWKPSAPGEPGWEAEAPVIDGQRMPRGRPGWHIECSAMARDILGGAFDIHGGGSDLRFPHHENELAQSRCAHPDEDFAQVWMHNEMLQVEGKKMSKSAGNFFTVRDLLDRGVPGEVIRFVLLGTHYGKPLDWTEERVKEAGEKLHSYHDTISKYSDAALADDTKASPEITVALSDDLNTHLALASLDQHAKRARQSGRSGSASLQLGHNLKLLGLLDVDEASKARAHWINPKTPEMSLDEQALVSTLKDKRIEAKANRNFERADQIRDKLAQAGISLKDTPTGTDWEPLSTYDPKKLEALR